MKKKLSIIVDIVLVFVIIFSLVKFGYNYYLNNRDAKVLNDIGNVTDKIIKENSSEEKKNDEIIKKYFKNDDIKGRIRISSIGVDAVLTQSSDNDYYMNHNIYKQKSFIGNPFIDYRINLNSSPIIIVYGHNSKNIKVPFRHLTRYLEEGTFSNNSYISLEINSISYTYKVFSVYGTTSSNLEHMKVNFGSNKSYLEHLNKLKNYSLYKNDVILDSDDNILLLQTCVYDKNIGDYLVIAAKRV